MPGIYTPGIMITEESTRKIEKSGLDMSAIEISGVKGAAVRKMPENDKQICICQKFVVSLHHHLCTFMRPIQMSEHKIIVRQIGLMPIFAPEKTGYLWFTR